MKWVMFVSRRFIQRDKTKTILISAIAISVMTLIAVLSIMNSFQSIVIRNLIHIDSYHLVIQEHVEPRVRRELLSVLAENERIKHLVPFAELNTIAHADASTPFGVSVRAIDRSAIEDVPDFVDRLNVVKGSFALSSREVVIGVPLAQSLAVDVGDSLLLYGHSGQNTQFRIGGLFYSRSPRLDNELIFMDIDSARTYINDSVPIYIGMIFHTLISEAELTAEISDSVRPIIGKNASLINWRSNNRAVLSALKIEKIFIVLTLGMIFIIVAINVYQSLARKVRQYTRELAILRATGATPHHLQLTITYMGLYIGIVGGVCGVVAGLWLALNVNRLFQIAERIANSVIQLLNVGIILLDTNVIAPLPYISNSLFFLITVDHTLLLRECVAIFVFAVSVSVGAAYFASQKSVHIEPIVVLRGMHLYEIKKRR